MNKQQRMLAAILLLGVSLVRAQTVEYIHTDALGSPVAVTDASGTVVIERTVYEPYGAVINRPVTNGPGYTEHVMDAVTGLNYMQQRYYDPQLGRFLSNDPVTAMSAGANFNRYWYANNNPYSYIDPDGRCPETPESASGGCDRPPGADETIEEVVVAATSTVALRTGTGVALEGVMTGLSPMVGATVSAPFLFLWPSSIGKDWVDTPIVTAETAPADAKDPNGAKAPGKPGEAEGFTDPKTGEKWMKGSDGRGGWVDSKGNIWQPTGPGSRAHGGAHWDVQKPNGTHVNVYPGGRKR